MALVGPLCTEGGVVSLEGVWPQWVWPHGGGRLTRDVASLEGVWSPWRGHRLIGCVYVCICIEMTVCVCVCVYGSLSVYLNG